MEKLITEDKIENSTFEAIYWWNRTENYYHNIFVELDEIYQDKKLFEFFIIKIFETFLREYAIRRNLSSGHKSICMFIDELIQNNFIIEVKQGNTDIIDNLSNKLKCNKKSTKRHTKSLLSKVAF